MGRYALPGNAETLTELGSGRVGWLNLNLQVGSHTINRVSTTSFFLTKEIHLVGDYSDGWPSDLAYSDDNDSFDESTVWTASEYNAELNETYFSLAGSTQFVDGANPNAGFNGMATLAVRADGSAANIAALLATSNDGSSAANAISWANLITDDANVNAGDIIELYDGGGSYTAATGIVLEMTADMSGTSGNPTIVRAAAGNTPVIQNTGNAIGIDFATGSNFIDVDLDVSVAATNDGVHASGTSGTNGSIYQFTNTYRGDVTGTAGVSSCEDGVATDDDAELRLMNMSFDDLIENGATSGQALTNHTNGKLLCINVNVRNCGVVYADGTPTACSLFWFGGEISGNNATGFETTGGIISNGSTTGMVHLDGVTITHANSSNALFQLTQNNQSARLQFYDCTFNLTGGTTNQMDSDSRFVNCTFNLTGSGFQIRQTQNSRCYFWNNTVNMATIEQMFRVQNGAQVDFQNNLFDMRNASGSGAVVGYNSYTGTQLGFVYNNRFIGSASDAQFTFIDCKVVGNTFAGFTLTSGRRSLDQGVTSGITGSETSQNIFHDCTGGNGAYFLDVSITPDYNIFSGTTASESEALGREIDIELDGNFYPTTLGVFEGARQLAGGDGGLGGRGKTINHGLTIQ